MGQLAPFRTMRRKAGSIEYMANFLFRAASLETDVLIAHPSNWKLATFQRCLVDIGLGLRLSSLPTYRQVQHRGGVAQLVEQRTHKPRVPRSIRGTATTRSQLDPETFLWLLATRQVLPVRQDLFISFMLGAASRAVLFYRMSIFLLE